MRLDTLPSHATTHGAAVRMDPYWAGMWAVGSTANWFSRASVERLVEQGRMRPPAWLSTSREDACEASAHGYKSRSSLRAVAALGCWRTLSTEQLACITGERSFANPASPLSQRLMATGLASSGIVAAPRTANIPRMVRPHGRDHELDELTGHLDDVGAAGVSHGQRWLPGSMHDRHNMLAAELLLRIAEFTSCRLVAGEQLSHIRQLTGVDVNRAGDGVLVMPDGYMVVIEATATTSANFPAKVEHWAGALTSARNLSVLFVEMAHPDQSSAQVDKAIRKQVRASTGALDMRTADVHRRMMVCSWRDWFPAAHEASDDFVTGRVQQFTGFGTGEWSDVELFDPFCDLPMRGPALGSHLVDNSNLLYGIPHWQQSGSAVIPDLVRRLDSGAQSWA